MNTRNQVRRTCQHCGTVFDVDEIQVRTRSGGKHCSMKCLRDAQRQRREERAARLTKRCAQCGKEFTAHPTTITRPSTGKLCSRQCWYDWQRAELSAQVDLICDTCGKAFTRTRAWVRKAGSSRTYCSRPCQHAGRVRPGSTNSRGKGWRRIAEAIRVRDGRRCVRCGVDEAEEGRRLSVDHIVPWLMTKDEEAANHEENLASLCGSCHGTKTSLVEPRFARGDWLAMYEFYGQERSDAAIARALP